MSTSSSAEGSKYVGYVALGAGCWLGLQNEGVRMISCDIAGSPSLEGDIRWVVWDGRLILDSVRWSRDEEEGKLES